MFQFFFVWRFVWFFNFFFSFCPASKIREKIGTDRFPVFFSTKLNPMTLLDTSHVLRSRSFNSATLPVRCTSFLSLDAITQVHNGREETGRKCYISRSCARTSFPPGFSLTWHRIGVKRATSALARGSRKTGGCPVRYRRFYTRLD